MPSSSLLLRPWRACAAGLALLLSCAGAALGAATGSVTGSVTGRVSDGATGKSLQGALVRVVGTNLRETTDADGRFSLAGVPAGSRAVAVDYVGLDQQVREVDVSGSGLAIVDVALFSEALRLEPFRVAESVRGQALAINRQKTARGIVNIVSEETFDSMIGGNIGYTLQHLPGLTVNEDEDGTPNAVNIRGLEAKYNSFQIDGNRVPSSGNTRAFATSQLTAQGISAIEVIKAPTPDRDGDAIGGIINVISRSAFQRDGRSVEVSGAGQYYGKFKRWGYDTGLNYLDILDAGAPRNLGVSLSLYRAETARDYDNLDKDYALLLPEFDPALVSQPTYFHTNGTPQTNIRDTVSSGANLGLDYRLAPQTTLHFRPFYSLTKTTAEKPRTRYYINANHNFTGTTGTKSIAAVTYNTGRSLPTTLTEIRYQNEESETENLAYGGALSLAHDFGPNRLDIDFFYSTNESDRPRSIGYVIRNPGFSIAYDQTNRAAPVYTILNGKDPFDISTINRGDLTIAPRTAGESARSGKIDWERKFAGDKVSGSVKLGTKLRVNRKEQDQASDVYRTGTNASGFPYASFLERSNYSVFGVPMILQPNMDKVGALLASSPALFAFQATESLRNRVINDYTAEEQISAAYVMGTLHIGRTVVIAGVRGERTDFESNTNRFNNTTTAATPVRAKRDYTVWLPGIHFRHELRRNLILRESYNRSYSRPDINLMVAGLQTDSTTGNVSGGNPNLRETTSDNFDIQLEYYTPRGGLYSAGFFYKRMEGFYYTSSYRFNTTDADGYPIPAAGGAFVFTTTDNALGAKNYGLELIARQSLHFLPQPFNGLEVNTSATFTESDGKYPGRLAEKLPTYGFSDTIYNAALEYNAAKFRARLAYTYRSDFLEGLDVDHTFDDYFGAYESLNFESSYQLTPKIRLFANVNNITDEPQISYQGFQRTDNPEDYTKYSYRITAGASVVF